jgi:hypothetical protein
MRSAERRFTWALIAGGIATGLGAGHTDAPVFNILVGLAWGVPVWIAAWCVLELAYYMQESRDASGNVKPERSRASNVHVMPGRSVDGER